MVRRSSRYSPPNGFGTLVSGLCRCGSRNALVRHVVRDLPHPVHVVGEAEQPRRDLVARQQAERGAHHGGARHFAERADMRQARGAVAGLEQRFASCRSSPAARRFCALPRTARRLAVCAASKNAGSRVGSGAASRQSLSGCGVWSGRCCCTADACVNAPAPPPCQAPAPLPSYAGLLTAEDRMSLFRTGRADPPDGRRRRLRRGDHRAASSSASQALVSRAAGVRRLRPQQARRRGQRLRRPDQRPRGLDGVLDMARSPACPSGCRTRPMRSRSKSRRSTCS